MKRRRQKHSLPQCETLEMRQQLSASTVFVLDYTPDYRTMGSLQETFYNVRLGNGSVPVMFDFDGNGRLTGNDVSVAADRISAQVRKHFAPYLSSSRLTIVSGDTNASSNQLLGDKWLRYGLKTNASNVSVMYFGGRSAGGEYGRAPLARNGFNVEGFGEVYVRSIAIDLVNRNPRATPADFVISVASTAAHELGHMMGLRHATSGPARNLMIPGRGRADNYFPNQATYTEDGPVQNAHQELWFSFQGQPAYYQVTNYGLPDVAPYEHSHDHEDDECLATGLLEHSEDHQDEESFHSIVLEWEDVPSEHYRSHDSCFARWRQAADGLRVPEQTGIEDAEPGSDVIIATESRDQVNGESPFAAVARRKPARGLSAMTWFHSITDWSTSGLPAERPDAFSHPDFPNDELEVISLVLPEVMVELDRPAASNVRSAEQGTVPKTGRPLERVEYSDQASPVSGEANQANLDAAIWLLMGSSMSTSVLPL